jgi:hypothetical protein
MGLGQADPSNLSVLTPLATRLCDAIESVAGTIPQLAMISLTLRKQMARNQVPDSDIMEQLVWLQEMIHQVITGPDEKPETDDTPIDYVLTPSDERILELLGGGEDLIPPHSMSGEDLIPAQVLDPCEGCERPDVKRDKHGQCMYCGMTSRKSTGV